MTKRTPLTSVASNLRLLLISRYRDLLLVIVIISIAKAILFLSSGIHLEDNDQPSTLFVLLRAVLDLVVSPGCLLTILYINRSVLRAEAVGLWQEFRLGIRDIFRYLVLEFIKYVPLGAVLWIIVRILVATHLIESGNHLFYGLAGFVTTALGGFIFFFSIPLLVEANVAYLKNVRQSLALFKHHRREILPMLGLSTLMGCMQLPESSHLVSRSADLLVIGLAGEITTILFYVLAMNYYTHCRAKS
jgi:hypothetical protein